MGNVVETTGMQCAWCGSASVFHCDDCKREHCENHIWECGQCGFDKVCVVSKEACKACSKILCHQCGNKARNRDRFMCDACTA